MYVYDEEIEMKDNRRKLMWMEAFSSIGEAVIGIFLPFLIGRAFGLSMVEVILLMSIMQLGLVVSVYPINRLVRALSTQKVISIGMALYSLFFIVLAIAPESRILVAMAAAFYVLSIVFYWPSWHVAFLHSSKDGQRGTFLGNLQMIFVGVNLVAPLLAGFFLDRGWDLGVLVISVTMFLFAILSLRNVELPRQKLSKFSKQWSVFRDDLWKTKHGLGIITEGIQGGTLWFLWPIFLGAALGSFTQMGFVVALAAIAELVSSKFFGKFTDQRSARKVLNLGQWFRSLDIGFRGLLMFFPSLFVASAVTVSAGFLGPIFNISFYSRTCEIAEKSAPRELEWFIAREWVLGTVRFIWMMIAAVAVYFWGEMVLGWFLIAAAVASVGFRRY